MKKFILILLSVLMSVNLLACSSSNVAAPNALVPTKKATINTIAINTSNKFNNSKWMNKTYISIGDSITWQDKQTYPNSKNIAIGYQSLLNEKIGFKNVINFSKSGASMAKSSKYPNYDSIMLKYSTQSYSNADLITIFAGTNDFKLNVPIGKIGIKEDKNYDDSTFYGSYQKLLDYILKQKPTLKIYLFTPLQRDNGGYNINNVNAAGAKLIDYVNAVNDIGKLYDLPVMDLYSNSGIDISNLKQYTRDGLHPNDEGYKLITKPIFDFIERN